jgi:hypothetical protein
MSRNDCEARCIADRAENSMRHDMVPHYFAASIERRITAPSFCGIAAASR